MENIIVTSKVAQEETRFLLPLPSTDVQGHKVTSYGLKKRLAELEITWVLQKPQINKLAGLSLCKDIIDSFSKPF